MDTLWKLSYRRISAGSRREVIELQLPLWILTVIFSAYPVYFLTPLHRLRKRKKLGLCLSCGYDLRASKERCPECGEEFETTLATGDFVEFRDE